MRKRIAALMITTIFALTGAGCSQNDSSGQAADSSNAQEEEAAEDGNAQETPAEDTGDTASSDTETAQEGQSESSNVLIAYFSVPEDVDTEGIDANAGASVVVREGQVMGNLEYMADVIQQTIGGDLFRIETVEEYPLDHEPLVDQAAEEQDEEARPELSTQILSWRNMTFPERPLFLLLPMVAAVFLTQWIPLQSFSQMQRSAMRD